MPPKVANQCADKDDDVRSMALAYICSSSQCVVQPPVLAHIILRETGILVRRWMFP